MTFRGAFLVLVLFYSCFKKFNGPCFWGLMQRLCDLARKNFVGTVLARAESEWISLPFSAFFCVSLIWFLTSKLWAFSGDSIHICCCWEIRAPGRRNFSRCQTSVSVPCPCASCARCKLIQNGWRTEQPSYFFLCQPFGCQLSCFCRYPGSGHTRITVVSKMDGTKQNAIPNSYYQCMAANATRFCVF